MKRMSLPLNILANQQKSSASHPQLKLYLTHAATFPRFTVTADESLY